MSAFAESGQRIDRAQVFKSPSPSTLPLVVTSPTVAGTPICTLARSWMPIYKELCCFAFRYPDGSKAHRNIKQVDVVHRVCTHRCPRFVDCDDIRSAQFEAGSKWCSFSLLLPLHPDPLSPTPRAEEINSEAKTQPIPMPSGWEFLPQLLSQRTAQVQGSEVPQSLPFKKSVGVILGECQQYLRRQIVYLIQFTK